MVLRAHSLPPLFGNSPPDTDWDLATALKTGGLSPSGRGLPEYGRARRLPSRAIFEQFSVWSFPAGALMTRTRGAAYCDDCAFSRDHQHRPHRAAPRETRRATTPGEQHTKDSCLPPGHVGDPETGGRHTCAGLPDATLNDLPGTNVVLVDTRAGGLQLR